MILKHDDQLFELKAKNLVASLTLPIKNKKLDGQSSSTLTTNQGSKAKVLSFACLIPFDQKKHLTKLIEVAEAIEDDGTRRIYKIQQAEAEVADIREVIFDGNLSFRKTEGLLAWSVNFSLLQYNSVPESKEARLQSKATNKTVKADNAQGQSVAATETDEQAMTTKTRNRFEQILKKIDTMLAPDNDSENA